MTLTSAAFFAFFFLLLAAYYLIPAKLQPVLMLIGGAVFFCLSATPLTGLYLLAAILVTAASVKGIQKYRSTDEAKAKAALWVGIALLLLMLAAVKYSAFFVSNLNALLGALSLKEISGFVPPKAPLGMSFYTLQAIGLLLDTMWGIAEPRGDLVGTALFVGWFPQLTSGPIARYGRTGASLTEPHAFDWDECCCGFIRMLWGVFKKLVISARLGVIVETVYGDVMTYNGLHIWFAAAVFMLQMYTDFSGCMDIVIGMARCFGVILPENFRTPFLSVTVQEYWQRWHSTLGEWLKDYILYPLLRSAAFRKLTKAVKQKWGKNAAKQIPTYLAMLIVWLLIGFWHGGGWRYILGMGLWFWFFIVFEQVFDPTAKKITAALHIRTESAAWHVFRSVRTFAIVAAGNVFFKADGLSHAIRILKMAFTSTAENAWWNPAVFFDRSLLSRLGSGGREFLVACVGLLAVAVISALSLRGTLSDYRKKIRPWIRWVLLFLLVFVILIFGVYGPGFNAADFIYRGF